MILHPGTINSIAILWYYIMYHIIYIYSSCTSFLLLQDVGSDISSITQEISDPEPKMTVTIGSLEKPKEVCIVACIFTYCFKLVIQ